jgi:hypothetical protein
MAAGRPGEASLSREGTMEKIKVESAPSSFGLLWLAGWLFTIGFPHLTFWKGVLAIAVWPYFLGAAFSSWMR